MRRPRYRDCYLAFPLVVVMLGCISPFLRGEVPEVALERSDTAFYPPGIFWLEHALRALSLPAPSQLEKTLLFAIGMTALVLTARRVLGIGWWSWFAITAIAVHPRFAYDSMIYRDLAGEIAGLGAGIAVLAWLAWPDAGRGRGSVVIAVVGGWVAFTAGMLFRVTVLTTALLVLAGLCVAATDGRLRTAWVWILVLLSISGAGLCERNRRVVGKFGLSTNLGYNLFLGAQPLYLAAHPQYDVDTFFEREYLPAHGFAASTTGEADADRSYTRRALELVRSDPAGFAYRSLVKSAWFWIGVEHVPALGGIAHLAEDGGRVVFDNPDGGGGRRLLVRLLYVIYRSVFLVPGTVLLGASLLRRRLDARWLVFALPLVGLWVPSVLTFPDTRFRLAGEAWAVIGILGAVRALSTREPRHRD